ncbi:MAG: ABC transporter ATP-binding protein [Clostridiales bacterium]|nr:ABC transporter ATP-binding protein [Clostridiales bacterium]MDY5514885.1 ABC transporter ATP-binding protein [Candidatus Ventricola sp.]
MDNRADNREVAIQLSGVKKRYKLGQIGGGTLQGDLQSWWARVRGKEDPNTKIGTDQRLVGQTFMALNGIDLTVYKGEALGIIGGNGAGKSTMLKLLSRVTAPTEGEIDIYGRIASMLEVGTGFNGEMTGRENIYMNGAILGMTKAEIDAKMEDIIEFSEVREFIDTPVKRYSSGMYVKLAFSVAAHLDSEIMIMDEVLAVGDMAFQKKCLDKMRDAAKQEGRTVLYVSHNMNTIRQLCDRCVVLDQGKIVFEGGVEEAISVYLGSDDEITSHYEYTKEFHSNDKSKGKLVLKSLDVINAQDMRLECGELIEVKLHCKASVTLESVRFRFEIQFQNGEKIGTMLTSRDVDFQRNQERVLQLQIDTAHLTPGKYRADIIAYTYDQFGNEDFLDGVYPGISFELSDVLNQHNQLSWLHQYWGHVHLHDIEINNP